MLKYCLLEFSTVDGIRAALLSATDLRWFMPLRLPKGEIMIARERHCQRDCQYPESASINLATVS